MSYSNLKHFPSTVTIFTIQSKIRKNLQVLKKISKSQNFLNQPKGTTNFFKSKIRKKSEHPFNL